MEVQRSIVLSNKGKTSSCSPRVSNLSLPRPVRHVRLSAASFDSSRLVVGHTAPEQYYPVADLHTACFHTPASDNDRLWKVFDRIWGLQINASLARRGAGRCVLLVAFNPDKAPPDDLQTALAAAEAAAAAAAAAEAGSSSSSSGNNGFAGDALQLPGVFAFPGTGYWLSRLVDRPVWPGLGRTHEELGIVGVAQVDTFGDIIPPRTLSPKRDGAFGWLPREGYAYISNVAVSPAARRRGVAQLLMSEAEALAASWGCVKAGLHVNPTNTPAVELYRSLRYKRGVLEAPWMPYIQGRPPDRCLLMIKQLPRNTNQQQQQQERMQQQEQQQQQQGQLVAAEGLGAAVCQQQESVAAAATIMACNTPTYGG